MNVERLPPKQRGRLTADSFRHEEKDRRGTLPIYLSDVKARHDKMVGLVERMMTADSLQLARCAGFDLAGAEPIIVSVTADRSAVMSRRRVP